MTWEAVQFFERATAPIVFWGWTGRGRLKRIPKIMLVIPRQRKIPAGLSPTIETYPIIKGINVPQSPNAPPNSRTENFFDFSGIVNPFLVSFEIY